MKNHLLIFAFFQLLFSCKNDCLECENKLKNCMLSAPLPVDLPEPDRKYVVSEKGALEIVVNAEDKYIYEGEEYELVEIIVIINGVMESKDPSERTLKILGDKMAHYDAVFQLIAFSKENGIKPILAFSAEQSN